MAFWLLLLAVAGDPISAARAHLKAHRPDAVVLDLADDVTLSAEQRPVAASVLVDAAEQAHRGHDGVIALQLAQMAHRRDGTNAEALHLLAELALEVRDDGEAERWCGAWQAQLPDDPHPALLRLRIAADEGDWDTVHALAGSLAADTRLSSADRRSAKAILARAPREQPGVPVVANADDAIHQAAEAAARDRELAFASRKQQDAPQVIVYGTSWCGFCKKARAYFRSRNIPFEDKDIDRDRDAKEEMIAKARAAGVSANGIPVIDVNGTILEGFDPKAIEQVLPR